MSNTTNNKTTGFGVNNKCLSESGYSGIFINVAKDSVAEALLLNDDGSFDLELLAKLISHKDSEIYLTGQKRDETVNKAEILKGLGIK